MDTNWLHLKDGTGMQDRNNLTDTPTATVSVGDTVCFSRPNLLTDRKCGRGHGHEGIMVDTALTVEQPSH